MKKTIYCWLSAVLLMQISNVALAQDTDYHPVISDTFSASLGYMRSSNAFNRHGASLQTLRSFSYQLRWLSRNRL